MMRTQSIHRSEFWIVLTFAMLFVVAWSMLNGRDLNWDFRNYHLYAGFAASGGRIAHDYFPATVQSYLLGYVYVPLYLAVSSGWETWAVQILLGIQAVPAVVAIWVIASRITVEGETTGIVCRLAMVVFACISPVFLSELGTSFADVSTGGLVLCAIALLLPRDMERLSLWQVSAAGLLAGAACALKMTNLPMCAALPLLLAVGRQQLPGTNLKNFGVLALGGVSAFLAIYGYWGWLLYERFGNPFFPVFLNKFFGSTEYLLENIALDRFRPRSLTEFLLRPVYMLDPVANLYTEVAAPDARYLTFFILLVPFAIRTTRYSYSSDTVLWRLSVYVLCTWLVWLLTSGNGRYAVVLSMLVGLCVVALTKAAWINDSWLGKVLKGSVFCLLALQLLLLTQSTRFRWDGRPAGHAPFFAPEVGSYLKAAPHIFVTLDSESNSWLAPFVSPKSIHVSPAGQYLIGPTTKAGRHMHDVFSSGKLPILVAFKNRVRGSYTEAFIPFSHVSNLLGLRPDLAKCKTIVMDRFTDIRQSVGENHGSEIEQALIVCEAVYDFDLAKKTAEEFSRDDDVFNIVEKSCPKLLKPAGGQSLCLPASKACGRSYVNSDTALMAYPDGGVVLLGFAAVQPAYLGVKSEILASGKISCPDMPGRYMPFSSANSVISKPKVDTE